MDNFVSLPYWCRNNFNAPSMSFLTSANVNVSNVTYMETRAFFHINGTELNTCRRFAPR